MQPDGKVVVAGFVFGARAELALVRYMIDGSLDSAFGSGGVATADYGTQGAGARDLLRQPDGKLVAVGETSPDSADFSASAFAVARFETSGQPDKSFYGGAISTDFGAWDSAWGVALQPDGKIVAGGFSGQIESGGFVTAEDFAVARYLGGRPPCKVPSVRGNKLAVAAKAIAKAHCRVGKVRRKASLKVKRGRVISQTPRARKRLPSRSKVNLVVSRGRR